MKENKTSKVGSCSNSLPKTKVNKFIGMPEDRYDGEDLRKDVQYIKTTLTELNVLVRGDKVSAQPEGLIQHVARNTQFRCNTTKVLWFLVFSTGALVLNQVMELF